MRLLAPDILNEALELPPGILLMGLLIGVLLWSLGAYSHRFWLVLTMTLVAGLHGLLYGPAYGMQPLVAGLLLAVATGALALSLVRVLVFAAGGVAALAVARALSPALDEPLICILVGGLVGVIFYRLWITLLASLVGAFFLSYSGMCLAEKWFKVDAIAVATRQGVLLNWAFGALVVVGVVVQYLLERRRARRRQEGAERAEHERKTLEDRARRTSLPRPTSWWSWGSKGKYRRAG